MWDVCFFSSVHELRKNVFIKFMTHIQTVAANVKTAANILRFVVVFDIVVVFLPF